MALIWGTLSHENIMPLLGICEGMGYRVAGFRFVTPYMKHDTLRQWRKKLNPSGAEVRDRVGLISKLHG
jgi:hypothetical protein